MAIGLIYLASGVATRLSIAFAGWLWDRVGLTTMAAPFARRHPRLLRRQELLYVRTVRKVLAAWIGRTDPRAPTESEPVGVGLIARSNNVRSFDEADGGRRTRGIPLAQDALS